ncbi:hypothetical protein MNBD_GAMMA15-2427, partial [hydrothermal vent metagenome]
MRKNEEMMSIRHLFLMLFSGVFWPSILIADDYPSSYIAKQLDEAKKAVVVSVTSMKPGQLIKVDYVSRPVWIY